MDEPLERSRRAFIGRSVTVAVGLASVGTLAGCSGQSGTAGSGTDGGTNGSGEGSDGTATPTPTGLQLETLDVGGSPGEQVAVKPAGEPVLLDFFATWCAPCKPQMAELRTVRDQHPDFHMLSVSQEEDADLIRDFWVEYEGTWPVAQDTQLKAFQEYDVTRIPTMIVLDAEGTEVWRHSGLSGAEDILEQVETART
jgi:thiol-disulfide isomerase/thioredoxin